MMKLFLAGFVVMGSSMSWWAWQQDTAPVSDVAVPRSDATAPQDTPPTITSGSYSVAVPPGGTLPPLVQPSRLPMVTSGETKFYYPTASQPSDPTAAELHKAMEKYREAGEGSPERDTLRTEIAELLGKQYDHLLSQHEQQVVELESRLTKLREQLDRRQAAKDKLVELKLELVLSQAEGLGWPEAPRTPGYYRSTPAGFAPTTILPGPPNSPNVPALGERSAMPSGAPGRSLTPATRPTPPPVPGEDEGASGDAPVSPPSVPQ